MTYETIAEGTAGTPHVGGRQFHDVTITVKHDHDAEKYRVDIVEKSGSGQGTHDEVHHEASVCAHAGHWSDAMRKAEECATRAEIETKYLVQAVSAAEREMENREAADAPAPTTST